MSVKKKIEKPKAKGVELRGRPSRKNKSEKISFTFDELIAKPKNLMSLYEFHHFFLICLEFQFKGKQVFVNDRNEIPRNEKFSMDCFKDDQNKCRFWKLLKTVITKTENSVACVPEFFDLVEGVAFYFVENKEILEEKVRNDEKIQKLLENFSENQKIVTEIAKVCEIWKEFFVNNNYGNA